MQIFFAEKSPQKIIAAIKEALGDRELAKIVAFTLDGKNLLVTISKLGTSVLTFSAKEQNEGMEYVLSHEKIGFSHRVFKDEVKDKIMKVIIKAGGKVQTA